MLLWKLIVTGVTSGVIEMLTVLSKTDRYRMTTRFPCFLPLLLEMMFWKLIVTNFSSRVVEMLILLSKTDRYKFQLKSCKSADCTLEGPWLQLLLQMETSLRLLVTE